MSPKIEIEEGSAWRPQEYVGPWQQRMTNSFLEVDCGERDVAPW